ncbi:MAG: immunoglobulin domain-containing protein, partial [Verrucomicrobia bacterium]|nr:immunoglobulin domain-containing protein [Verrucomicrobiota bacterium]
GTLDNTFNPGASSTVNSLALQADGKILVGGWFATLGGQSRTNIGRLNNTEPAIQSLTYGGSTITWLHGSTSPEAWRTAFDHSGDGLTWTNLGAGTRIPGGWQLAGVSLPPGGTIRARGHVTGGQYNASSWFVEAYIGAPVFISQPTSRTNDAGTPATFSVLVAGTEPFGCQWFKNGVALADGGRIIGALTSTLAVSNVFGGDTGGGYSVVVTNAQGSVISAVAVLTVRDPLITGQPASQVSNTGESASFNVVAAGTVPLSYQWRKAGGPLAGATASSLTLTSLQVADAGNYDVVVSNIFGSVTSTVAVLSVTDPFNPWPDNEVYSIAVQVDGRILVGGMFLSWAAECRRNVGLHLQSGHTWWWWYPSQRESAGGANGRQDSVGRLFHYAGRADAQLPWATECRRDAGQHL